MIDKKGGHEPPFLITLTSTSVNNAGITRDKLLMRMTKEQWDSVIAVNLKSVYNRTKAVLKTMLKQKNGGTPEDVANTAIFLASDLSSYVSGQIIHVCGGLLT